MAGSSGGAGGVPPGFRFHPTDEELLHFYLKKKISFQKFDMEVIREVDLNKIEPWELQEKCKIGSTPQNEWYFFSHKDRKYPTGSRTNRATSAGFWKATGRDKCIRNSFNKIGMRKTLVFYRGRAPHGQKTDWIMHEYRLEDSSQDPQPTHEDGWVICRVFKKKNLFKIAGSSSSGELGGHQHHQHHQHHHHSNNNGNGMMMMMNGGDDHLSTSSTSAASSMNHLQYLNYSHHIPHYAAQVEAAAHNNFISNSSHMNLNTSTTNYDHHQDHLENYNNNEVMGGSPNILQVKQFMSSSTRSADHHDSSQLPMDPHQQQHNQDQWDGQLVITTNPPASTPTQINQLSLRSTEMQDFWAYGK